MSTKTQARPLFAATLTPHRSLGPTGRRLVIGLVAALALVPGLVFYLAGAWPVVGFMGLDVLAIWLAFTISMRRARAYEELTLWPAALELKQVDAAGHVEQLNFSPREVRFVVERDFQERVTALWLRQGERKVQLGAFLSSEDMGSLSRAFGTALRKARSG